VDGAAKITDRLTVKGATKITQKLAVENNNR
jgi:hypothetical protein